MDAVGEVGIVLVAAQILEGKNGDALLRNCRQLAGDASPEQALWPSTVTLD